MLCCIEEQVVNFLSILYRNQDSGLNSSLGNSSYGSGSAVVNTPPRGRGPGHIYGTQDAIAKLYSSPTGTRRPGPPGNQANQLQGHQAGSHGNRYTGNQPMEQTGSRNLGHEVVNSENTAFRSYQSNTFAGRTSYNPQSSQYDRRPQTAYAQVRPPNPLPQTETSASNSRYNNPSNRYNSPQRTSNQPVSGGEGHSNAHQETGFENYSMPKGMFYNPTVSQTGSQYTDIPPHNRPYNEARSNVPTHIRPYNEAQSNVPPHSRPYNEPQHRNIPGGHSVAQNGPYPNASMFYNHPESQTAETSGLMENGGSVVQPTWQYVGNGSIPSAGQSQGYTPSSYQQKVS